MVVEGLELNPTQRETLVSLRAQLKIQTSVLIAAAGVDKPNFTNLTHAEACQVIKFAMERKRENVRNQALS